MIETIILNNTEFNKSVLIDKEESFYVLDEADLGTIEASHHDSKYPEQIGSSSTGSSLGTREISISGWVIGHSEDEIKERKRILNTLVNPLHILDLICEGYKLEFKPKNTVKYSVSYPENNDVLCKFLISGKCFNPLFKSLEDTKIDAATNIGVFHFPLVFPEEGIVMSYRSPSLTVNVVNNGDLYTGFTIIFEAEGRVKNPKLTNIATQEFICIEKELEAGEQIIICTEDGNERVKGTLNGKTSNYYRYMSLDSSWMTLDVGDNVLVYSSDTNTDLLNVTFLYNDKYLEVQ